MNRHPIAIYSAIARQVRYLDLPDRQDLRKLQQLREEQGELSAADERRLKTLQVWASNTRRTCGFSTLHELCP